MYLELTRTNICIAPANSVSHNPQGLDHSRFYTPSILHQFQDFLQYLIHMTQDTQCFCSNNTYNPFCTIYGHIIGEALFPPIHLGATLAAPCEHQGHPQSREAQT